MNTTPLPPITKYSAPMLKNWPWTDAELAWVADRDAKWKAYATQACADLEAEVQRLREALDWCIAEINRDSPAVLNARATLEKTK